MTQDMILYKYRVVIHMKLKTAKEKHYINTLDIIKTHMFT